MKPEIFFSVLAFCPPVNSVFRHPKPRFSKTVPRVELFSESPPYRFCEQTRTEFFEYNYVIHHIAHALSMVLSYLCLTFLCGRVLFVVSFFLKTKKKESPFSKCPDTCGRSPTRFSHKASPLA